MNESQALIYAFALLLSFGCAGCSPKDNVSSNTEGDVESPPPPQVVKTLYDMEFVWIPPSGDQWKDECRGRGIPYKPVAGFYLQTREVSLSQYRDMGGDVGGYSSVTDVDWSQVAVVPDWVQAVNRGHFLSSNDSGFDYRLPTIYEWLYAYRYATRPERSDLTKLDFEWVTSGHFEFAADSVLDLSLPIDYEAAHARETERLSFAMGQPIGKGHEEPSWSVIANRTPPGGDDGIDEQTSVRFVLVPKTSLGRATATQ